MELKSTDGGCLLTGGAAVIFIITRIRRRPSHNILGTAPGPARKCEQEMELDKGRGLSSQMRHTWALAPAWSLSGEIEYPSSHKTALFLFSRKSRVCCLTWSFHRP